MDGKTILRKSEIEQIIATTDANAMGTNAADALLIQEQMAPLPAIPAEVKYQPSASSGIVGVINQVTTTKSSASKATQFATGPESISVELASNADIATLEATWEDILSKNEDLLKGYEPFYSVDTTADGDVKELFRLRIGPMKSVSAGDKLCQKLGRRGSTCSVIRVQ